MKITKTTPENKAFFNEHGSSLGAYALIGFIGQLLSGLSLAYAVYALLLAEVLKQGIQNVTLPLVLAALLVAVFIELANRILARRAIKPFVVKGLFAEDPQLAGRHKILNNSYLVGLLAIACLSYFLSAVGSSYYAEDSTEIPELIKVDSLKEIYAGQVKDLRADFTRDSMTIAGPFEIRLQAARDRFVSDSLALRKEREKYRACANAGNNWCKNKLTDYLARIDRSKAAMNDSLALISSLKGKALMTVLNDRNTKAQNIEKEKSSTLFLANQKNDELLKEKTADSSFKGLVFIILTIAGQTVFYLMIYLSLQVEAGSDIQYEIEPNEFWNLPAMIDELKVMIAWRLERGLRRSIRWLFGEPGEHETDIPYRGLFENPNRNTNPNPNLNGNTNTKKNTSSKTPKPVRVPSLLPKNDPEVRVTFTAHENPSNLADLKQRLRLYKKRLASHVQKKIKHEKTGKKVSKRTLTAIENNTYWVQEYTKQIQELESKFA